MIACVCGGAGFAHDTSQHVTMLLALLIAHAQHRQHYQHFQEVVVQHLLQPEEQEQVMLSLQEDRTHQAGLPLQTQSAGSLPQVIAIFVSFLFPLHLITRITIHGLP